MRLAGADSGSSLGNDNNSFAKLIYSKKIRPLVLFKYID